MKILPMQDVRAIGLKLEGCFGSSFAVNLPISLINSKFIHSKMHTGSMVSTATCVTLDVAIAVQSGETTHTIERVQTWHSGWF